MTREIKPTVKASPGEWQDWRWQLRHCVGRPGNVPGLTDVAAAYSALDRVVERYPFRATPYYLSLADWTDPRDPILLQCRPDVLELSETEAEACVPDPFGEGMSPPVPGLVRRFRDRALILATTECAVYCRHCTRKNTLRQQGGSPSRDYFVPMLDYLRSEPCIREVIVSGGDPLLLEDELLDWLLGELGLIRHIEVLRIGTRVPVVLPMRLTPELSDVLARHRPLWVNTQFNHPVELSDHAVAACDGLLRRGIPVSNQAVLLKGVNDSAEVMGALCRDLQRHMIRPYYAFLCDPVAGISHLRTDAATAAAIAEALRVSLGGLALPRFVADVPGEAGKVPVERLADAQQPAAPLPASGDPSSVISHQ
jgi:lysine 2,3-aminomutase